LSKKLAIQGVDISSPPHTNMTRQKHSDRINLQKSPIFAGLFHQRDLAISGSLYIVYSLYQHDTSTAFLPDRFAKEPYFCRALLSKSPIFAGLFCQRYQFLQGFFVTVFCQRALFLQGSFVIDFCQRALFLQGSFVSLLSKRTSNSSSLHIVATLSQQYLSTTF